MSENRKSNNGAWLVTGLGFGALAGILLAPRSGRETREAIVAEADRGRKYLMSLGRSGKKMFARTTKQVSAAIDVGRKRAQEILKRTA
jgi:gas vesicle protein